MWYVYAALAFAHTVYPAGVDMPGLSSSFRERVSSSGRPALHGAFLIPLSHSTVVVRRLLSSFRRARKCG